MATRTKAAKPKRRFRKLVLSVPILAQNAGKSADVRKQNAEKEFKQLVFPNLKNHELYDVTGITWRGPVKPQKKNYVMTVGLKRNKQQGPPTDPAVAQPKTPPPSA